MAPKSAFLQLQHQVSQACHRLLQALSGLALSDARFFAGNPLDFLGSFFSIGQTHREKHDPEYAEDFRTSVLQTCVFSCFFATKAQLVIDRSMIHQVGMIMG